MSEPDSGNLLDAVFSIERYMPHGYCLLWQPELVWMHVISDMVIALAYLAIPSTIAFLLVKRKQTVPFRWVFVMFALFIVLCGISHLVGIIVLWHPFYYFQGIVKVFTAMVSIATAVLLFPLMPRFLDIFAEYKADKKRK